MRVSRPALLLTLRCLVVFSLLCAPPGAAAAEDVVYLSCGRLFDGSSAALRGPIAIIVRDGLIADIGENLPVPPGAATIDLSAYTTLPGLIDADTHIALHPGDYDSQILRETPEFRTLYASVNARRTLEAGITTIRDLGNEGAGLADVALRDAINQGLVPGPRIVAAIQPIVASGAYGLVGFSPYATLPRIAHEADGPVEVRRQVRALVHSGADVIKVYMETFEKKQPAGDVLSGSRTYSDEELRALIDEAHAAGVKVAAHTYSDDNARRAIDAGADSIEHGLYVTEATFRIMAARGVAYVPTLLVYELWRDAKIFPTSTADTRRRLKNTVDRHADAFRAALRTPVKIVMGSDTFELPGTNAQELVAMVRTGMTPIEALRAATSRGADLLGLAGQAGVLRKGAFADIIAVPGDPLTDISGVTRPVFVMKAGRVIVDRVTVDRR